MLSKLLSEKEQETLLHTLKTRFEKHKSRHSNLDWNTVKERLHKYPDKLYSLFLMENTGGEPDVVGINKENGAYLFFDCSIESPKGRRSLCYDKEALEYRKKFKPKDNAEDVAKSMGINILTEDDYRFLQTLGRFDLKTSSWIKTPENIRTLGGALFGDFRFGRVFFYHNGAESYYAARGFRGKLSV